MPVEEPFDCLGESAIGGAARSVTRLPRVFYPSFIKPKDIDACK